MHGYSDEELIEVYKNSEGSRRKKAFDFLYLRYSRPVTQYFYFALHYDYEKAKDFFHDLFIKILESPEKFDTTQQFKPWIYKVASNMCKNYYRNLDVIIRYNEHILKTEKISSDLNESDRKLANCIKKLNNEQRSLIVLRYNLNLSIKEIAEIYECPEGTIKSRLFYTTKELSKLYKD